MIKDEDKIYVNVSDESDFIDEIQKNNKKIWICSKCNARHKYLNCTGPKPEQCECGCKEFE